MADTVQARLEWIEGLRFVAHAGSGHGVVLDSPSRAGQLGCGPMEMVLMGVAGCTAMDVVSILEKMRQPLAGLEVALDGSRAESHPKRFTALEFVYTLRGRGLSREKAERAVELSHSTYCSALASLRPDCAVTTRIEIVEE